MLSVQVLLLITTTLYQAIAVLLEDRRSPPGQLIDVGDYRLHLCVKGEAKPTIIVETSLGGVEGYFLLDKLAQVARVCIYDRAGYGWSDHSPHPRTSQQMIKELDILLTKAGIEPPYIFVGDSFGSYNVRLYAHLFPEKVAGIVLTDALHETGMLKMPIPLQALKLFFLSGFVMSTIGSTMGIIRLLELCGVFELIKPQLRNCPPDSLKQVKRSFCHPKHWITMSREIVNLDTSSRQVSKAGHLGTIPIVSIKSSAFFKPSVWTIFIPLQGANKLRDKMHRKLGNLSTNCLQIDASKSSHFVWVDEPEVIVDAVKALILRTRKFVG